MNTSKSALLELHKVENLIATRNEMAWSENLQVPLDSPIQAWIPFNDERNSGGTHKAGAAISYTPGPIGFA